MAEQNGRRREFYSRRLAELEAKLAAVEDDLESAPTASARLPLEKKADQLLTEIDEVEAKLAALDANAAEPGLRDRSFEKALQKIDFNQAKEIAALIRQKLNQDGGAVLFFLQRTRMQMGHFCVAEVLNVLLGDQIIDGQVVGAYRKYSIDLSSAISQLNETEFLIRLGSYLNLEPQTDADALCQLIRATLRDSIDNGTTVFLEIKSLDDLLERQDFLAWFIDEFWQPLIDEISAVSKEFKSKFIVALIADSQILPDCSAPDFPAAYFCDETAFDCYKLMSLPLPNWSVDDIQDWLIRFRPMFPTLQPQTKADLQALARRVHRMSGDGIPQSVCANLLQELFR